ncbi:hypothetical protein SAMN05216600_1355 [Pseudomonas cuatrocienegasensis]|uniref:Uncharacterized protein n=1 Tax=Pseudomonas cuatrocienegasensis TaxID=543360 RepID=A0ABY1BRQ3_9PSED|nr:MULTISPECIES: hypothetical protein [Pseudomonas]OEC32599.1 hypothetical protein A7D25_23285 [Pseudomonas sp. 21C1]SER47412.1 hypothetical protein SAMN05216600_1355 [Pseudomonas cuatrocienegasensis]
MIALIYIVFFVVYGLISIFVINKFYRFSKRRYSKGWVGGWLAALLMYNLVFWDWIPVYVMHKYYCSTEAGFWVYKSPGQWIKENPDMVGRKWGVNEIGKYETINEDTHRSWSSDRIYMEYTQTRSFNDAIGRSESVLVDKATGNALARAIEFYRGSPGALALGANSLSDYKIWLSLGHRNCGPTTAIQGFMDFFSSNRYALEQLGKGEVK